MLNVFHPTDLTPESQFAFAHALRIALAKDSKLTSLHVGAPGDDASWDKFPSVRLMLERWGFLEQGTDRDALRDHDISIDRVEAASHHPVRAILNYLDDHPADLIVLATHGRQGFHRWFEGSVAESVARVSRTMSLFVGHNARGFVDMETGKVSLNNILVPVVPTPDPQVALDAARRLMRTLGVVDARIRACYIGEPDSAPLFPEEDIPLMIRQGAVAESLVAAAKEFETDLVVMATEGRNGILDALRGSTTEQVLRSCVCPVLAVPAQNGANATTPL